MTGKTVLVAGVFDIIHPGHIELLRRAKALAGSGGKLVVLIARDSTVEAMDGKPPVMSEEARKFIVENLKPVDEVMLGFKPPSVERVLEAVKPDLVVLGYDQSGFKTRVLEAAGRLGLKVKVVQMSRFKHYTPSSSSEVKRLIAERCTVMRS